MIGRLGDSQLFDVFVMDCKDGLQENPDVLDKSPEDPYTKVKIKLVTPQKRRTAMIQNTITYFNLTVIYGEQVVLDVWRG